MTDYAKNSVKENPLGTAPLIPLIAKFAIPSIISMLVGAAYNVTDQIFIGHVVGMLGNAATNVAFPTVTLTTGISMLFGMGTASNFSINQGAGRIEEARKYVHTGLTGVMIAGILVGLLVYFFRSPIIVLCGADPAGKLYGTPLECGPAQGGRAASGGRALALRAPHAPHEDRPR